MYQINSQSNEGLCTLEFRFRVLPAKPKNPMGSNCLLGIECHVLDVSDSQYTGYPVGGLSLIGGQGWADDYDKARQDALAQALELIDPKYRSKQIHADAWTTYVKEYGLSSGTRKV